MAALQYEQEKQRERAKSGYSVHKNVNSAVVGSNNSGKVDRGTSGADINNSDNFAVEIIEDSEVAETAAAGTTSATAAAATTTTTAAAAKIVLDASHYAAQSAALRLHRVQTDAVEAQLRYVRK